jgi:hypothetical protein
MVAVFGLKSELENHFNGWFPGCRTELEVAPSSQKVGGFVVWDGFAGQSQKQRQAALWSRLRELPISEQLQISAIFTVTNDELRSMRENE